MPEKRVKPPISMMVHSSSLQYPVARMAMAVRAKAMAADKIN
jgi:hypothetical protein